jgi:RNase P/RNase MRP subunit p29
VVDIVMAWHANWKKAKAMKRLALILCAAIPLGLLAGTVAVRAVQFATASETDVAGTVSAEFGNRFVLETETGKVLVDAGPSWYRDLDLTAGEKVIVTGRREGGKLEALTLRRGDGSVVTIRSSSDAAPWAGNRRGWLGRIKAAAAQFNSETMVDGTVGDVFGNSFVVENEAGAVLVDAGPAWYRAVDIQGGEQLSAIGRIEDRAMEAILIVRAGGQVERLRPTSGPPPWSGKRRGYLSYLH